MRKLTVIGLAVAAIASSSSPALASGFTDRIPLPNGISPEDIAIGRGSTFYVGSLADGRVYSGDLRTGQGRVLVPGSPGRAAVGVVVDRRNRLWITGGPAGDVRVVDADTGRALGSFSLVPSGGFVSDVVVTEEAAYLTDSVLQQLYVVPLGHRGALPDQAQVRTVPLTGDIQYTTTPVPFNANGIVYAGGTLLVGQTNTGKLFRVDPSTGETDEVELTGGDILFADGIALRGRTLYAAQNFSNSVAIVKLNGSLTAGRVVNTIRDPRFDIPASVDVIGSRLFVLNARFTTPATPDTTYDIVSVRSPFAGWHWR
jgi:outer membrane protein assembly factor BamB